MPTPKLTKPYLLDQQPCTAGARYIRRHRNLRDAWNKCTHPLWMLWALRRLTTTPRTQTRKLITAFLASAKEAGVTNWRIAYVQQERKFISLYTAAHYLNLDERNVAESKRQCAIIRKLVKPFARSTRSE